MSLTISKFKKEAQRSYTEKEVVKLKFSGDYNIEITPDKNEISGEEGLYVVVRNSDEWLEDTYIHSASPLQINKNNVENAYKLIVAVVEEDIESKRYYNNDEDEYDEY